MRLSFYGPGLVLVLGACQPDTSRPALVPKPESAGQEIRLPVREATRRLADALRADTIPVRRVELRDGYMETPWFDARTGRPTNRRAVGTGVVRVRAWADPARPGNSLLTVETVYHPLQDPSLPNRELEQTVPLDHRIAKKVAGVLTRMAQRYGAPPPPEPSGARPQPAESDAE